MKSKNIFNIIQFIVIFLTLIFNFTMNCEGDDKIDIKFIIFLIAWGFLSYKTGRFIKKYFGITRFEENEEAREVAKYAEEFFKEDN